MLYFKYSEQCSNFLKSVVISQSYSKCADKVTADMMKQVYIFRVFLFHIDLHTYYGSELFTGHPLSLDPTRPTK